ncbi:SpoIIE family protein phosphatase [Planomonospora venezuelensis]|uniref:histidine kinase n=1 Tax=Planomonospora venezuelensis TaxID=1999 RepID=A0A841D2P4_PLAVE|nr:SpoIIE family protein phosphatase [Planomonospora venezuelensis]MBB5964511.1 signal transduction histidine kinase [Planomonospora venezuelensis]GIN05299.1 hypothetical protein Pve01_69570 [Planomonospora venezuelensis]
MTQRPVPTDDVQRLYELDELDALGSGVEPRFDAVAELAAQLCQAPIALVNLIGADGQHFKGRAGDGVAGLTPPIPFCPHVLTGRQMLEVPDAAADPRFGGEPLVTQEPRVLSYAGAPVLSGRGHVLGTVCVMDVRPRRLAAGQLRGLATLAGTVADVLQLRHYGRRFGQVTQQLHEAEELKHQFLRTMNHEMRTPLTGISSYLELIQDGSVDPATEREFLRVIERNSDRLLELIDELLLLASLTARTVTFQPDRVDVAALVRQTVIETVGKAWHNGVVLTAHAHGEVSVWADAQRLRQVLSQLLDNAIKFTSSGGRIDVTVCGDPVPTVEVRDNGMGIDAADLPYVFEDFYRSRQAEAKAIAGTGAGLAIVKKIMRMHGGTVHITSRPGQGTCVRLELPCPPPLPESPARTDAQRDGAPPPMPTPPARPNGRTARHTATPATARSRTVSSDGEQMFGGLITAQHLTSLEDFPALVTTYAGLVGLTAPMLYAADLQHRFLMPLPGQHDHNGEELKHLRIDATMAGRAFRTLEIVQARLTDDSPDPDGPPVQPFTDDGPRRWWLPLLDGTECIGVLGVTAPGDDETLRVRAARLAGLIAVMISSKSPTSDTYARLVRAQPMHLSTEILWTLLPVRTFANERVVVSAALEPAYLAGGDAFDHALAGDTLHLSIFDAMGHDTAAGLTSTIALGACRNHRRQGADLPATGDAIDAAIAEQFAGDRFATGVLAGLDTRTGLLTWVNRGHHPPLVLRGGHLAAVLEAEPDPPMGLGAGALTEPSSYQLEPGDRLLLYTDGILKAKSPDGQEFGLERFIDFLIRREADGLPAPETLRRLIQTLLEHQHDHLDDDATVLLVEWRTQRQYQFVP